MHIRNSIKAIIIQNHHILLTKNNDGHEFYLCPGGGQDFAESFHETLKRECLEEAGAKVDAGELLFVREYIEDRDGKPGQHAVECYFHCHLLDSQLLEPTEPDKYQVDVEWVPFERLELIHMYPTKLKDYLLQYIKGEPSPVYLGNIN
ncbi:NUDIX domain-containing protein [Piscibacillus halophilus]|uniref:ADP-ribose pyrophosphatase YjhB, NUDIX family n=1 Tax=Piscibacillus halophilus TaxID=571933 RepID=A0A1H9FYN5_9BACI|nr:NUDIX domain-containing protein [Piscibacillus halophilus]SEQ42976.1 ADP-ribose pyrophosphatase YjhB, NUDIX family [Piscibacillus halophilus]